MRYLNAGPMLGIAAGAMCFLTLPALATKAVPPELNNTRISVFYQKTDAYAEIAERYKKLRLLERISQFLSPIRLPQRLALRMKECGQLNMFYTSSESRITICYEFLYWLEEIVAPVTPIDGVTRDDVILGGLIGPILHEAGHAVFDILRVPVLGREEDAADQISEYVLLNFGSDLVKPMIKGMAFVLKNLGSDPSDAGSDAFTDEHGTPSQRYYNTLCMAYGHDRAGFEEIAIVTGLPPERMKNCENEFRQVEQAFAKTVLPNIDVTLMQKVQSVPWLLTEFD